MQSTLAIHAEGFPSAAALRETVKIYTISDQDDAGRWIRDTFPELFYIVSPSSQDWQEYYRATWTGISRDRLFKIGPLHHFDLVTEPWLDANVRKGHGPLGARYPRIAALMEGDTPSFLNLIANGLGGDRSPAWGGWGGRYVRHRANGESRPHGAHRRRARAHQRACHDLALA